MTIDLRHEIFVFVSAFLCGQVICVIFDAFRAVRKNISPSVQIVNIQDIIFGSVALCIIYRTLAYVNDAVIRWYEIVSLFLACTVYFLFESRWIFKALTVIFSWFIKPVMIVKGKLHILINSVRMRFFNPMVGRFAGFSKNCIKKFIKTPKNHN